MRRFLAQHTAQNN